MKISLALLATLLMSVQVSAETSVVPPGVRAFVYHRVNAEIKSHLGPNGVENPYAMKERIKVDVIAQAEPRAEAVIQRIRQSNPEILEGMDLGTLDAKPDIRVNVDVFGGAFGVTKNFMLVGVVPVYQANVNIAGGFYSTQSLTATADRLESMANADPNAPRADYMALAQFLRQLAVPTGNHVQGVLTNSLGYKPVGNWSGSGIGDMIFFGQLRTTDTPQYKQGWKVGAEVPTGRTDDPDNLLDVPFGKGHFVSFVESLHDFYVWGNKWILAANAKFAYQWGHTPTYRLVPDNGIPLTSEKGQVYRKPGNIGSLNLHSEVKIVSDVYFHTDYIFTKKGRDKFSGANNGYDYSILERNTEQTSHVGELGVSFTTANLFMQNRFPVPFKVGTFVSRVLDGENVDKIDMATLRFEMYF